jgi:hypothetical protein
VALDRAAGRAAVGVRNGDTVAVVHKKKFLVTSAVAKTVAGVLLKRSLAAAATSVTKMKKPTFKTILKDADDFQWRPC